MKNWKAGLFVALALIGVTAHAGMQYLDGTSTVIGNFSEAHCTQGVTCASVNGRVKIAVGQQIQDTGTSTVMTSYQCGGTYITSGAATMILPEASGVLGCRYTFVVGATAPVYIDPADTTDQIQVLTNSAGDRISNAVIGSSIILQAVSANGWAAVGKEQGTWADSN